MEKKLLEAEAAIIELNQRKKDILNLMLSLELENKTDTDQYISDIGLYKWTWLAYREKIAELDFKDKCNIEYHILKSYSCFDKQLAFSQAVSSKDDQYVTFRRLFVDFGSKLLLLYANRSKSALLDALTLLGLDFGEDAIKTAVDDDYVNECMISDFTNVLYTEVNKFLNCNLSKENRELLMRLKYNLLFLSPALEKRAIITAFSIPEVPHLVNKETIYETGLDYHEYTREFDDVMSKQLEMLIRGCLSYVGVDNKPLDFLDLVFIKAFASSVEDYELLDCLQVKHSTIASNNFVAASDIINETLEQSKRDAMKNKELRQYTRI